MRRITCGRSLSSPSIEPPRGRRRVAARRGALALAALALIARSPHAGAEVQRALPAGRPGVARPVYPPYYCDYIRALAVDYLNDDASIPHAFSIAAGTLAPQVPREPAAFTVFGLGREGSFANVTSEFRPGRFHRRRLGLTAEARPASGSRPVPARVYLTEPGGVPRLVFRPRRHYRDDRTVRLTFRYNCYRGVTETTFELLVKGTDG